MHPPARPAPPLPPLPLPRSPQPDRLLLLDRPPADRARAHTAILCFWGVLVLGSALNMAARVRRARSLRTQLHAAWAGQPCLCVGRALCPQCPGKRWRCLQQFSSLRSCSFPTAPFRGCADPRVQQRQAGRLPGRLRRAAGQHLLQPQRPADRGVR